MCVLLMESTQLAFSSVKIINAIGSLHNEFMQDGLTLFTNDEPVSIAARNCAGVLVTGCARFRGLRFVDKRQPVLSKATRLAHVAIICVIVTLTWLDHD